MNLAQRKGHHLLYVSSAHEQFFRGLAHGARALGFEHCAYLIGVPAAEEGWRYVMMSNLPWAWRERYSRKGFHTIDPTVQYAKQASRPLVWSTGLYAPASLRDLRRGLRAIGYNHGWTQPLRDVDGRFAMLTLARGQEPLGAVELREKLPTLRWFAQSAHAVLFRTLLARCQDGILGHLTVREIDILRMTADGKTALEIAAAMGVTERTATFHIGNAIEKLGAANKAHAVACAMRLGLLD
jgi:LuxR family transcriptional regulator